MNLQLTGYRATGKTTVAQHLAELSQWPWLDTDRLIEARAGSSIQSIFAELGEPAFRELERHVIADVAGNDECILSLGGGAVLDPDNRAALQAGGRAVWLRASVAAIHERMEGDFDSVTARPALTENSPLDEIAEVLHRREPIYDEFSAWSIDTDQLSPRQVAEQIWDWFRT